MNSLTIGPNTNFQLMPLKLKLEKLIFCKFKRKKLVLKLAVGTSDNYTWVS